MDEIELSIRELINRLVERLPAVTGALASTSDGLALVNRIPDGDDVDVPAVAAMSAAVAGLANRLVGVTGDSGADMSHQRSPDGQVFVFRVGEIAVLTVFADANPEVEQIRLIGTEAAKELHRLVRSATFV